MHPSTTIFAFWKKIAAILYWNIMSKIRIVTAASLFDGHDAAINIMRRVLQSKGAEIIHLGHNRSVKEIVEAAIEEDANGIAITSYQGGHIEFFQYMKDLLDQSGCGHIRIFGGGGGTILPEEIRELHHYGIERIYSPDDGRAMGLEGMIEDVISRCKEAIPEYDAAPEKWADHTVMDEVKDIRKVARAITLAENNPSPEKAELLKSGAPVLGITGTGGAGKSSVTDEIVRRYLNQFPESFLLTPPKRKPVVRYWVIASA
ncbi:MAG: cobalamin-dependent protein [Chitinophagaceae bacterium]|nr:cobalamin-dependent protein [Chitinophagaceae bacterium]